MSYLWSSLVFKFSFKYLYIHFPCDHNYFDWNSIRRGASPDDETSSLTTQSYDGSPAVKKLRYAGETYHLILLALEGCTG